MKAWFEKTMPAEGIFQMVLSRDGQIIRAVHTDGVSGSLSVAAEEDPPGAPFAIPL